MNRFLALIMMAAMALFIAGPAMAQVPTVTKSVTNSNTAKTTFNTDVTVDKDVNITIDGRTTPIPAKGSVDVSGDSIFKEMDVNVQDQEAVVKFFELDDSAHSSWTTGGNGLMFAAEQLQNGLDNVATILQDDKFGLKEGMHVGLQYQVGDLNNASLEQHVCSPGMNNFAKQIQIGTSNVAIGSQF